MSTAPAPASISVDDNASVDEQFSRAWEHFFRAVRRVRARGDLLGSSPLTLSQYHLLDPLWEGPRTVGVLASAAGVAAPTATRALDSMVRAGIVARRPSETDRRAVYVELTPAGRTALRAARQAVRAYRRRVVEQLSATDRADAVRLLDLLADAAERA